MSKDGKTTPTTSQIVSKGVAVPSKYHRLGSVTDAPYFNLATGNQFEGKLLGVFERVNERAQNDPKLPKMVKFFQLELITPAEVKEGSGESAVVKQAEPGTVINLNCGKKTEVLLPCAAEINLGAEYDVFVHCGKKKTLKNKNTMWDITVGINQIKAPTATASGPDFDDDDGDDAQE
jgi:hypothetical protein